MPQLPNFVHSTNLRDQIAANLQQFDDQRLEAATKTGAAVALTIFAYQDQAALAVTKRTPKLKAHGGQWALPGGRIDAGETQIEAALREMHEEVNLDLPNAAVIGLLDDYVTRSGYIITPVVVWSDTDIEDLHPNPDEVASIHAFSFTELAREDSPNLESIPQSDREVLSMNFLDDRIYSPTAAMLYQFREVCILGNQTRVAHYDQPLFAWK
jgi:8-oxo-dGTP pyrophosphatase MutT (NUDIX family)